MSVYVIAKRSTEQLDTPVFHAGPSDSEEAIAVFSDRNHAQRYIDDAQWSDQYEVGELDVFQLFRWIVKAYEQGTQYVTVDPNRQTHLAGQQQEVLIIEEKLASFAESLTRDILKQHDTTR